MAERSLIGFYPVVCGGCIQTSYLTLTCPFKFVQLDGNADDEEYDIDEQFYADSVSQVC